MRKIKKPKKGKSVQQKGMAQDALAPSASRSIDDENNLNFGGLPDRDLKKNLGCG